PPRRPTRPGAAPRPRVPTVTEALLPAPLPAAPKARSLQAVAGKGIWTTNFARDRVDVAAVVARARAAGVRNVWVRTGGRTGYYGDRVLPRLVPAAHAAGLTVVAWDFPYLSDPVADARRAQRAFDDGADAFAPDVETAAEGTFATDRRVRLYLSLVRRAAGTRPVAATVPRPTPKRLATFPYAAFVPYADLFAPMVYWSCNEPGRLVVQSLSRLGRLLPVAPVGQAYDMGEEGGRRGLPTRGETLRFLDVAKRGGAVGASLWTYEQTGPAQWGALRDYAWER
ncbi:MAG: Peptidoglycan-binding domain 1 protein, partial [Frankiales bacterium]|nr:Peptidoglycan-binding domain 1 protein [Frankiales bacterium]